MNTEIFDYLKALAKKEFYYANFFVSVCSIVIIIAGIYSVVNGASMPTYSIMFGCATLVLAINAYKSIRRHSKSAWFFIIASLCMLGVTSLFAYVLFFK